MFNITNQFSKFKKKQVITYFISILENKYTRRKHRKMRSLDNSLKDKWPSRN